eukprot:COSAG05_NODE_18781_length_303_cov_0.725490_1_plen_82_part_10
MISVIFWRRQVGSHGVVSRLVAAKVEEASVDVRYRVNAPPLHFNDRLAEAWQRAKDREASRELLCVPERPEDRKILQADSLG